MGSTYSSGDTRVAYPGLTLDLSIPNLGYQDKVVTGSPLFNDGPVQCYNEFGLSSTPSWYNSNYNSKVIFVTK